MAAKKRKISEVDDGLDTRSQQLAVRAPPTYSDWERDRRWGIVIDAGSSGSRLQVYSWIDHKVAREQRLARGDGVAVLPKIGKGVEQGEDWTLKVEPGISSLANNPAGVDEYLGPLLDHARSIIPPSQLANTPVYLLATAGMRLLPTSQSDAILSNACRYIRNSTPFRLDDCDNQVRIISGEEEGVYGWIAINYLMDGFDAHGVADKGKGRHSSTYGFLDMGGASTQIAFEPSTKARKEHADNLLSVNLRLLDGMDVHHPVFVTTWLGYGTNQARERYVDASIAQYLKEHPPDPESSASVGSEKPMNVVADPCLPKSLLLTETRHPGYALQGTGDFPACLKKAAPLLNKELPCPEEPCLMGVHVPPIDFNVNHFIGISEYWYSTQDIWSLGGAYDFPTFEKSALEYCSQNWENIVKDHSEGGSRWAAGKKPADVHRLEMQCFKAAWIVNVLHDGIGIPRMAVDKGGGGGKGNGTEDVLIKAGEKGFATSPSSFQSVNEINNVAVSWTLGRMVLEVTDSIPRSAAAASHDHDEDANTPAFEWRSSHATWKNRIGNGFRNGYDRSNPLVLLAIVLLAVGLYFFCWRGRRRSGSSSSKPAREDYGLISMEEGDNELDDNNMDSASPRKTTNSVYRSLLPLRIFASRVVSAVHKQPKASYSLPITRAKSPTQPNFVQPKPKPIRPTQNLRHVASSPALFRGSPPSTLLGFAQSAPTSKANLHLDLSGTSMHESGIPPPLTPPALPWQTRMKASPKRSPSSRKTASKRPLYSADNSNSDSEGFLSVPVGVSSTAPSLANGGSTWENGSNDGFPLGLLNGSGSVSPEEGGHTGKPGLRSRNSSYTNLGALGRRGGHLRLSSAEVA